MCKGPVSTQSTTGYCRLCINKATASPERSANISASLKRAFAANPEMKARARATIIKNGQTEAAKRSRSEAAKACGLSRHGLKAIAADPSIIAKRAAKQSAVKLAHIPREMREEYKRLRLSKKLTAAEAESVVMEQYEAEMERWRKSLEPSAYKRACHG